LQEVLLTRSNNVLDTTPVACVLLCLFIRRCRATVAGELSRWAAELGLTFPMLFKNLFRTDQNEYTMNLQKTLNWGVVIAVLMLMMLGVVLHSIGGKPSSEQLVTVATNALIENGHGNLLRSNGLNVSPSNPYATQMGSDKAQVTIPYKSNLAPVQDVEVNLVHDSKTNSWSAISYTDGGGELRPIDWHPQ